MSRAQKIGSEPGAAAFSVSGVQANGSLRTDHCPMIAPIVVRRIFGADFSEVS